MKYLLLLFVLVFVSCNKPTETSVSIELEIHDPEVTILPDGTRQLDITVEITQLGNYFFRDFQLWVKSYDKGLLDTVSETLPSAREFVHHRTIVPGPGHYLLDAQLGETQNGSYSSRLITVD